MCCDRLALGGSRPAAARGAGRSRLSDSALCEIVADAHEGAEVARSERFQRGQELRHVSSRAGRRCVLQNCGCHGLAKGLGGAEQEDHGGAARDQELEDDLLSLLASSRVEIRKVRSYTMNYCSRRLRVVSRARGGLAFGQFAAKGGKGRKGSAEDLHAAWPAAARSQHDSAARLDDHSIARDACALAAPRPAL